eukprot:1008290-Heterocapsa_arctica.AAC.1
MATGKSDLRDFTNKIPPAPRHLGIHDGALQIAAGTSRVQPSRIRQRHEDPAIQGVPTSGEVQSPVIALGMPTLSALGTADGTPSGTQR